MRFGGGTWRDAGRGEQLEQSSGSGELALKFWDMWGF